MPISPVVRYMILCDDWKCEPENNNRVTIVGLLSYFRSTGSPPYPLRLRELCVFLVLTEGRGQGEGKIVCVFEDTGQKVFETPARIISFGSNPLEILGAPFRIRDCPFSQPDLYSVQFWYDGLMVDERPLLMR
jgi:hypothetical protein